MAHDSLQLRKNGANNSTLDVVIVKHDVGFAVALPITSLV